mgnify:CR=1 FL=1
MAFHNRDKKDFNAGIMFNVIGGFFLHPIKFPDQRMVLRLA